MEPNREQIIKALECCGADNNDITTCDRCLFEPKEGRKGSLECNDELMRIALTLIKSQEQRISAQDVTISDLRQRAEKAEHDKDRYFDKIKEVAKENERLTSLCVSKDIIIDEMAKNTNEINRLLGGLTKEIEGDTVRKVQAWLRERVKGIYLDEAAVNDIINHIPEEL